MPCYLTSDNINDPTLDQNRLTALCKLLRSKKIRCETMGIGPNKHIDVLKNPLVPSNATIVNFYGGLDAQLIYEMGTKWYKTLKGTRNVYSVFFGTTPSLATISFLNKAWDDKSDFPGLAWPAKYLINNGYHYTQATNLSGIAYNIVKYYFPQITW